MCIHEHWNPGTALESVVVSQLEAFGWSSSVMSMSLSGHSEKHSHCNLCHQRSRFNTEKTALCGFHPKNVFLSEEVKRFPRPNSDFSTLRVSVHAPYWRRLLRFEGNRLRQTPSHEKYHDGEATNNTAHMLHGAGTFTDMTGWFLG